MSSVSWAKEFLTEILNEKQNEIKDTEDISIPRIFLIRIFNRKIGMSLPTFNNIILILKSEGVINKKHFLKGELAYNFDLKMALKFLSD